MYALAASVSNPGYVVSIIYDTMRCRRRSFELLQLSPSQSARTDKVAMALNHLNANSQCADLESFGPFSSVLAALRTLQHKGPRLPKSS